MKRFITSSLFIIAVIAGSVSCGGGRKKIADGGEGNTRATAGFVIALSDSLIRYRGVDTLDFGRVREGEQVVREFKIKNVGDKAMVITKLDLSCGCVEAEYPRQPLRPGEEGDMRMTLDTRNMGGWIFKTAIMQTSLSSKGYIIYITAEIE